MGNEIKITLEGGEQLIRRLEQLGVELGDVVEDATLAGASIVFEQATNDVPGDGLGVLQEVTDRTDTSATVGIGASKHHFYLNILESGRAAFPLNPSGAKALLIDREFASKANIPARAGRPWLRPALDDNVQAIIDEIGAEFWQAIEESIR